MSGHSKWANIKHRKGAADIKKGKVFSRLGKEKNQATWVFPGFGALKPTVPYL